MNLTELYSRLAYGELSNLSMSETTPGDIATASRPKIVLHLNTALKKLYERFNLKEKSFIIEVLEGKYEYKIHTDYSITGAVTSGKTPYILDSTDEPFVDDIVRMLDAYNDRGVQLPLNDAGRPNSLFTPQRDILQIPNHSAGDKIAVNYQAYCSAIVVGSGATIDIPIALEPALTSYIAYCVYTNMNTQESTAKAQEHLAAYEACCATMEEKNILSTSNVETSTKFEQNGWV